MGTIQKGGGGCACPENAFLKSLLSHLVIARKDWVILDMEAGIEHLGRGTALGVDEMVIVVEPSQASIDTAKRIKKLSSDIGLAHLRVIGNKVQNSSEKKFLSENLKGFDSIGFIDFSDEIKKINLKEASALDIGGSPVVQMEQLLEKAGWRNSQP
jgi:CO dehydrogenase maturation factor